MGRISKADKDAQIIKDNPGKSPHEYRLLGVSEEKVSQLIEREKDAITAKQQPIQPNIIKEEPKQKVKPDIQKTDMHRATPFIKKPPMPTSDTVNVVERSTGKATAMSRHFAERFIKKNSKTHVIR